MKGVKYEFSAIPWQYGTSGGWYFVTLPIALSEEIRTIFKSEEEGWGRLKATARVGKSEWKTAIWFDTKTNAYSLSLKAEIRAAENISAGKHVDVLIWI
ncbi:DUF1905 domain-containing protein [Saccharicrinis sp. FJH54]|uniref:DUF1905 domain-containing protein n=1 Tax=Saccharicrinis sp. FJH54 TaxID=3344665 RepID=UPI0035D49C23